MNEKMKELTDTLRYAAPYTLGFLMVIAFVFTNKVLTYGAEGNIHPLIIIMTVVGFVLAFWYLIRTLASSIHRITS